MGAIYDATWGRAFAALYDRGLKATEENGLRRDAARAAGRGEREGDRDRRRDRGQPRPLPEARRGPDHGRARPAHGSSSFERRPAGTGSGGDDLGRLGRRSFPSPTTASTPPSRPWSSARSPTRSAALSELARVLKPGGKLLFIEHVRADDPGLARWQDRLEKPWRFLADGCHCNRDTVATIEASALSSSRSSRASCRRRRRSSGRWSAAALFSAPESKSDLVVGPFVYEQSRRLCTSTKIRSASQHALFNFAKLWHAAEGTSGRGHFPPSTHEPNAR